MSKKHGRIKDAWLKFKRYCLPYPLAYLFKGIMKLLLFTCRWQIKGLDDFVKIASQGRCILVLWHNRLAILPEFLSSHAPQFKYAAMISNSRDGAPLSVLTNSYKAGSTIKVAHHLRHEALKEAIYRLRSGKDVVVITPDGPRGPRYKIKPGVVLASKEAEAKVVAFTWESDGFWQLKTWDLLRIPKPFSTIQVSFAPVSFQGGCEKLTLEEGAARMEAALFELEAR